jgi:hypothetical protein
MVAMVAMVAMVGMVAMVAKHVIMVALVAIPMCICLDCQGNHGTSPCKPWCCQVQEQGTLH